MKIRNDVIWAVLLLLTTAIIVLYLESRNQRDQLEETMNIRIKEKSDSIGVLKNKIRQLSEELTSRGIFSYPQAQIITRDNDTAAVVLITLNGKETIPNLEIKRKSTVRYGNNSDRKVSERPFSANIGNLTPHNPVTFEIDDFQKRMDINLVYDSGKKKWHQYITARRTPEGEIKTMWVITDENFKVIDKHVDNGFPTNKEGYFPLGENQTVTYDEIKLDSIFQF